jgi:uncharacterized repeat protein (TIGR03803 family)
MKQKILFLAMLVMTAATLPAQTLTTLYNFSLETGSPIGGLVLSGDTLLGTTVDGGDALGGAGHGTVFSINTNGTDFFMLANLTSDEVDSRGNLVLANGTLYGASFGGSDGSVFSINTNGDYLTDLHIFTNSPDGSYPYGSLTLSSNTLYGTTFRGGSDGYGTVFSINTNGTDFAVLHSFTNWPDGAGPAASVVVSGNMLYGTTVTGGNIDNNYGMVFSMNIDGSDFTVLYNFTGDSDGASPLAGLILSSNTLYGTTSEGGDDGYIPITITQVGFIRPGDTPLLTFAPIDCTLPQRMEPRTSLAASKCDWNECGSRFRCGEVLPRRHCAVGLDSAI